MPPDKQGSTVTANSADGVAAETESKMSLSARLIHMQAKPTGEAGKLFIGGQSRARAPSAERSGLAAGPAKRRVLTKLDRKRCRLATKFNESLNKHWRDLEPDHNQDYSYNSVGTFDLFKYAAPREQVAVCVGIVFMWYAASWQPISVFILATMAALMGQYSRQAAWIQQLEQVTVPTSPLANSTAAAMADAAQATAQALSGEAALATTTAAPDSAMLFGIPMRSPSLPSRLSEAAQLATPSAPYEGLPMLAPLGSFVAPIFDLAETLATSHSASSTNSSINYTNYTGGLSEQASDESIRAAVHDILSHESRQFLRKSFEINGSAFLLALTQLVAFSLGMALISWSARRQAARIKVLYFRSCLNQEVSWFESVADSASGSGSSLNALVDRYEDGIGVKLALLCYFLGHVGLFALTAFWQMFRLAAFCMPFVLAVGLIIAYLSEFQAIAIGRHVLFAKRSLQLAEETISAIRTVFAFNGQQKELARFSVSLRPVYKRSLIKHLYTALTTSLSKFSIFACFSAYCFYAMRLFPPYDEQPKLYKATVLAVMRGAEVSIVNVLISIPFMEALQQSRGSIGRIYATIERRSKISATAMPDGGRGQRPAGSEWSPSISFRQVQFDYIERANCSATSSSTTQKAAAISPTSKQSEPSRGSRLSLLPSLFGTLAGQQAPFSSAGKESLAHKDAAVSATNSDGRESASAAAAEASERRRRSLIGQLAEAAAEFESKQRVSTGSGETSIIAGGQGASKAAAAAIRRMLGRELGDVKERAGGARVLDKFSLEIKAGQSVALVGPSGSGKSTVLALVQRLYESTGGQILIGQNDIKDLSVAWLRNQIAVVAQEPRLFDMTIGENIRLGLANEDTADDNESAEGNAEANKTTTTTTTVREREASIAQRVVEAAQAAGAHEFIVRLPAGYETRVGSAGLQLSGGQKQRIAISRALIRRPKILLLDECTSALDSESEAQVQAALAAASKGRTVLTVAHRLSTIRHVDLIVVMSRGQVVECGSHQELMERSIEKHGSCIYKQMFERQQQEAERSSPASKRPAPSASAELGCSAGKSLSPLGRVEFKQANNTGDSGDDNNDAKANGDDDRAAAAGQLKGFSESQQAIECDNESDYDDDLYYEDSNWPHKRKPSALQLWQFIKMPKWSSLAACLVCLIAGLILPMNLIAHSYLFSAFAYEDLEQISDYLRAFGLVMLSFSSLVFVVTFLQIVLPGYVGEKLSVRLRVKTMDSLLSKPMFYFDMDSNSAGGLCNRFNSYISSIQGIAGVRVATMLEAISTLAAGAFFGFGQNLPLSSFCLSFALLVLLTTIIESRIVQRESSLRQKFDAQLAHLIADALSNIKTIASLNKETFFIERFSSIIEQRELGIGRCLSWLRIFLTSIKFVMPAMSWSASMYYGCYLLVDSRIDLQTIFIVCPVVLFAVNDTFRALVFLPELIEARNALARLFLMCREFSPEVLQTLTLAQQLEQQHQLHLEQLTAAANAAADCAKLATAKQQKSDCQAHLASTTRQQHHHHQQQQQQQQQQGGDSRRKKSISFIELPPQQTQAAPTATCLKISLDDERAISENNDDNFDSEEAARASRKSIDRRRLSCLPSYMRRKSSRLNSLVPSSRARGRIEFRDVEFAYPNRPDALVLDGFSLSVGPGESVALVGGSGSGKSTCVAILEKFYDYHAGHVSLDGNDLRLVASGWVRSQVGLVSQEPTLLSYTIADNIRYGDNSRFVGLDEIVAAARTANIHDFIMSLPEQYDTELSGGNSGNQLSGGQKQRIAIARALVSRASILIFDEATSALDARNETIVLDALNKAKRGRTSITIAHRLASVRDADKIVVMNAGKVVEIGRHEELMQNEYGHYRRLWQHQEGSRKEQTY